MYEWREKKALKENLFCLNDNKMEVTQIIIETNKKVANDVYLSALSKDIEFDQTQRDALFAIASLTPYIGGEGVYSARVMLGLDPDDLNLPYRKKNHQPNTEQSIHTIQLKNLQAGIYFYHLIGNKTFKGKIIIMD